MFNFVYVPDRNENCVWIIDEDRETVLSSIPVGNGPCSLEMDPTRKRIYVLNSGSQDISIIDMLENQVTGTIPIDEPPTFMAMSSDGESLYVHLRSGSVSVFGIEQFQKTAQIQLPAERSEVESQASATPRHQPNGTHEGIIHRPIREHLDRADSSPQPETREQPEEPKALEEPVELPHPPLPEENTSALPDPFDSSLKLEPELPQDQKMDSLSLSLPGMPLPMPAGNWNMPGGAFDPQALFPFPSQFPGPQASGQPFNFGSLMNLNGNQGGSPLDFGQLLGPSPVITRVRAKRSSHFYIRAGVLERLRNRIRKLGLPPEMVKMLENNLTSAIYQLRQFIKNLRKLVRLQLLSEQKALPLITEVKKIISMSDAIR